MKLVRFSTSQLPSIQWGLLEGPQIFPLKEDPFVKKPESNGTAVPLADCRLHAPCQPRKVVALAVNYEGATGQSSQMSEPLAFLKPGTSVCGPGDTVACPFSHVPVWGESELAIVIGSHVRHADETEAARAIFGYTAANDVSADNVDSRDHHLARSKGADTFCPLGPWIDTAYQPDNKTVEAYQNGELIRRGNTNQRIWRDHRIVSWLSHWMTLEPGDVILTGTPPRIVPRRYLEPNDVFSVRIEGFSPLDNPFQRHSGQCGA
jgi:2-keto-4-pentenoate hydratase/2-oxohepta-3-ene-1,7-dioic acid hydratase in catechol pathway